MMGALAEKRDAALAQLVAFWEEGGGRLTTLADGSIVPRRQRLAEVIEEARAAVYAARGYHPDEKAEQAKAQQAAEAPAPKPKKAQPTKLAEGVPSATTPDPEADPA